MEQGSGGQEAPTPLSPFAAAALKPHGFTSESESGPAASAAPAAAAAAPTLGVAPSGPHSVHSPSGSVGAASRSTGRSPASSRSASPTPLDAAGGRGASSSSAFSLDRVLSSVLSLRLTAAERSGPSECRTLLPGVDLRAHGVAESQLPGNELPVIMAPKGLNLKAALDRDGSASDLAGEPSFGLGGQGAASGLIQRGSGQQQSRPVPSSATVQAGAAAAPSPPRSRPPSALRPRSPGAGSGRNSPASPLQPPRPLSPVPGGTRQQQQQQQQKKAGSEEEGSADVVAPRESSSKENGAAAGQQQQPASLVDAQGLASAGERENAAEQPQEPDLAVGERQQRPWTVDGTPASLAVADLRAPSLDIQWWAHSALRMWPMLAPFVPCLLREDILSLHPRCRSISDIMVPARGGFDNGERPAQLRPCVELLPAAVMIADITGFTALTEALSTKGSAGVELLTKCMNRYFSQVIELLLQFGGDVMKFAGDSMIVAFWPTEGEAASEDGGLRAATLRALTCASELCDKFGAMRMLPTGEAIPVPRSERVKGADDQEGAEWFEDIVHRAQDFFVTGSEQVVRPMTALFHGAARPVSVAAKPVGFMLHGTAGSLTAAASVGISTASKLSSQFRGPRYVAPGKGLTHRGRRQRRVNSTPDAAGTESDSESVRDATAGEQSGSAAGTPRGLTPCRHTRSFAGSVASRLARSPARAADSSREVWRTKSDVTSSFNQALDDIFQSPEQDTPTAAAAGSMLATHLSRSSLSGLSPGQASVRPPELPHHRSSSHQTREEAVAVHSRTPSKVILHLASAPADVLAPSGEDASPHPQGTGSEQRVHVHEDPPSRGFPRPASAPLFYTEAPSISGTSFSSVTSTFQAGTLEAQAGLPPIKARVTEEGLEADSYEVLTITAGADGSPPQAPLASRAPTPAPERAQSGNFPWSLRFHKLLRKARKAPKRVWHMSMGKPASSSSAAGSAPSGAVAPQATVDRMASTMSSVSGISELETLAAFSRRVRSSAWPLGSSAQGLVTPTSPSRRHLLLRRRQPSSSLGKGGPQGPVAKEDQRLQLSLKVMVGAGTVGVFHVGGGQQASVAGSHGMPHWEFFIGDPPEAPQALDDHSKQQPIIAQLASIEPLAMAGEAVLSSEVAHLVAGACHTEELPSGAVWLREVLAPSQLPPEAAGGQDAGGSFDRVAQEAVKEVAALSALPDELQSRALNILRMHVLENVRLRIEAGHIDYVNEIRTCTVLFLGFPSLNRPLEGQFDSPQAAAEAKLAKVQQAVEVVQKKMRQFDGSFVQFRSDEKGYLAICAFGLPGRSHENGPVRGLQAALAITEAMKKRGGEAVVGVTTGQLFCAMVGSRRRTEYTVFGDAINLSARLMVKAKEGLAEVLCDSVTYHRAPSKVHYQALLPLAVKGKRLPVEIYAVAPLRPGLLVLPGPGAEPSQTDGAHQEHEQALRPGLQLAELPRMLSTNYSSEGMGASKPIIGRGDVLEAIVGRVQQLVEQHTGGVVLVEGEPGIGKTRLIEELQQSELGGMYDLCTMFSGSGRTERKSQSFYPWRRIFRELLLHDRELGQLYCLRASTPQQPHVVITQLGKRLRDAHCDYDSWVHVLADALDLPLSDFPVPPPQPQQEFALEGLQPLASADIEILPASSRAHQAFQLVPTASWASRALREDEHEFVVDSERPRSFAMRFRRSASATQAQQAHSVPSPLRSPTRNINHLISSPLSQPRSNGGSSSGSQLSRRSGGSAGSEGPDEQPVMARRASNRSALARMTRAATARNFLGPQLGADPAAPQFKEVSGHLKTKKILELLVAIIREFANAYGPLVLILEDLHFFDSSSWKLLGVALDELLESVLFVATYRPIFNDLFAMRQLSTKEMLHKKIEAAYRHVLQKPSTLLITLQPFTIEDTRQYISMCLGGLEVGTDIARLVWEKSNGLPSFIEQLITYLQLQLEQGPGLQGEGISLSGPDLVLHAMDLIRNTVSIHSTITDRVDWLRPEEQLMLKVASVLGLTIYVDLLMSTHPQEPTMQQTEASLRGLEAALFLQQDPAEPTTWVFTKALARDVVYDLIPVGQRRDWHARLAFSMELFQGEHHLPASTIAYHWTASCKLVEVTQWWKVIKAIQFWEKAAMEAISRGAYADGLPLLQKAQDLSAILAEYYGTDEESAAQKTQGMAAPKGLSMLPSGLVTHPSGPASALSTHGSRDGATNGSLVMLPVVPLLRRIHWERCMAAMCLASEVSVQSLNQAMLHCLRALVLLGVPMPWDKAYRLRRRWWHCSFDACFVAGWCCLSRSKLQGAGEEMAGGLGELSIRRGGEQEMADLAFLSRPGTFLGSAPVPQGSLEMPMGLVMQLGRQSDSTFLEGPSTIPSGPVALAAPGASSSKVPAAATAAAATGSHQQWWYETHLQPASEGAASPAQQQEQGMAFTVQEPLTPMLQQQGQAGAGFPPQLAMQSPFASTPVRPSRAPGPGEDSAVPAAQAEASGSARLSTEPSLVLLVNGRRPTGASQQLGGSGSGRNAAHEAGGPRQQELWQHQPHDAAGPWSNGEDAGGGEAAPASAGVVGRLDECPRQRQLSFEVATAPPATTATAAAAQDAATPAPGQQLDQGWHSLEGKASLPSTQSVPSEWLRSQGGRSNRLPSGPRVPKGSFSGAQAGRSRPRVGGEEALEAAVVMEVLVTVLLMPEHLDLEDLRYAMWACKWLEGRRPHEDSLFYSAWLDCANALHHYRRTGRAGIFTLRPLASMMGFMMGLGPGSARQQQ